MSDKEKIMKDLLHKEQRLFFDKQKEWEKQHSTYDEDGDLIERAVMPHKGYNFSMSYDAFYNAMQSYAEHHLEDVLGEVEKFIQNEYSTSSNPLIIGTEDHRKAGAEDILNLLKQRKG